jgi:hypothetical protein
MLQINDAPVQIQVVMASQYKLLNNHRRRSHQKPLLSRRTLHRRLQKIVTILTTLTQSICRSTTQMRKIKKQRNGVTLKGKLEPLNVNEFCRQLASLLGTMSVDPLLRSPVNTGLLPWFRTG